MGRFSGQGKNGTGGSRPRLHYNANEHAMQVGPIAAEVGLLQAVLAAKGLSVRQREMAQSMLLRARTGPLSAGQVAWLVGTADMVGAVYEAPDVQPVPAGAVGVERWGVLPARPPRRPLPSDA